VYDIIYLRRTQFLFYSRIQTDRFQYSAAFLTLQTNYLTER